MRLSASCHRRLVRLGRRRKEAPEVRRILQELGAAVRAIDEDFCRLRAAISTSREANEAGVQAVITDVRYPNEAASLRRAGFHLVYIERPDVEQLVHESEGALGAGGAGRRRSITGPAWTPAPRVRTPNRLASWSAAACRAAKDPGGPHHVGAREPSRAACAERISQPQ
ncbi:hypothetical protein SMICM17S_06537 [Streptomyces microflavus]